MGLIRRNKTVHIYNCNGINWSVNWFPRIHKFSKVIIFWCFIFLSINNTIFILQIDFHKRVFLLPFLQYNGIIQMSFHFILFSIDEVTIWQDLSSQLGLVRFKVSIYQPFSFLDFTYFLSRVLQYTIIFKTIFQTS